MPSLADLEKLIPLAGTVIQGINNTGAVNAATGNLVNGANQAMGTITDASKVAQNTLDTSHAASQGLLSPYQTAGTEALGTLQSGLKPGGGMADPFTWLPPDLQNDPIFQRRLAQGQAAIEAKANAGGTRFSGASMKDFADYATGTANDYLAQDYTRNENTFRANQADSFNRTLALEQQGQQAANAGVNENTNYGSNTVALTTGTSKSIAELETEKASALAGGNIAQANAIDNLIKGLTSNATNMSQASTAQAGSAVQKANGLDPANPNNAGANSGTGLNTSSAANGMDPANPNNAGLNSGTGTNPSGQPAQTEQNFNPATGQWEAPLAGGVTAAAGAAAASGAGTAALAPVSSVVIGGVPEAAAAGESAAGAVIPGTAGSTAGGVVGSVESGLQTVSKFLMNNPWTIAAGAAITAALIWHHSQVHQTANQWTQGMQTQFGQHLSSIVNGFDQGLKSGQMTKEQAQVAYQQTSDLINAMEQKATQFAAEKGGKGKTVVDQFHQEMLKDFGPNYSGILQKMQSEIAGLPDQGAA